MIITCTQCDERRPMCHDGGKNDYGYPIFPVCVECCGDCEPDYAADSEEGDDA